MKEMNTLNTTTTTTEETVNTENNAMVYMDRFGFLHSSREECIEANRG